MEIPSVSRRRFLREAALSGAVLALAGKQLHAAKFKHELGFQLYTLRNLFSKNPGEAFKRLSASGYTRVEVLRANLDTLGPLMKSAGLKPIAGHFDTAILTGGAGAATLPKGYDWGAAIAQAKSHGLKYMVIPYIAPNERGKDLDFYKKLSEKLNKAGEACRAAGLGLCYHNHAFEFEPMGASRPMDVLIAECDKKLVGFEVDIFWVSVAGLDPATFLKSISGRAPLIHLKDKAKGTQNAFSEGQMPPGAFKEVGAGVLNIPQILEAADKAGARLYFVEQDQCPGDPVDSLIQSCKYLRGLK